MDSEKYFTIPLRNNFSASELWELLDASPLWRKTGPYEFTKGKDTIIFKEGLYPLGRWKTIRIKSKNKGLMMCSDFSYDEIRKENGFIWFKNSRGDSAFVALGKPEEEELNE